MPGSLTRKCILFPFLLLISSSASAIGLLFEAGVHLGGDDLVTGTFTTGDNEKIKAGELLSLSAGIAGDLGASLEGRLTIGFKFDRISASNGAVTFDRVPVDALLFYKGRDGWLFGGGITRHLSPDITTEDFTPALNIEFDDATGVILAIDYLFPNGVHAGGRLTFIDYEVGSVSVDGNSIGAVLGIRF